jgi:hypothetical protein
MGTPQYGEQQFRAGLFNVSNTAAQGPNLFNGCQHGELLSPESYGPEADPPHLRFASTVLQR